MLGWGEGVLAQPVPEAAGGPEALVTLPPALERPGALSNQEAPEPYIDDEARQHILEGVPRTLVGGHGRASFTRCSSITSRGRRPN